MLPRADPPSARASVDAVIPAFNVPAAVLHAAVAAASRLAGPGSRVIVIDDGSEPPASLDRADDLPPAIDQHPILIRQSNSGPSAARNRGMDASAAPWVLLLDADDLPIPEGVAAMIDLAERLGAGAAVAARVEFDASGRERPRPVPVEWGGRLLPHPGDVFRPIGLFGASGVVIRREVLAAGARFDEQLRIGEDRDFLRRVGERWPIAVAPAPALRVRLHADTGRRAMNLQSRRNIDRRIADHILLLDRWNDPHSRRWQRDATAWLLNAASKWGASDASWDALTAAARARGWPVPVRPRARRALRGIFSRA